MLLSFDARPSTREGDNPTARMLDCLAHNAIQLGIKECRPAMQVRIPGFWSSLLVWLLPEPP